MYSFRLKGTAKRKSDRTQNDGHAYATICIRCATRFIRWRQSDKAAFKVLQKAIHRTAVDPMKGETERVHSINVLPDPTRT